MGPFREEQIVRYALSLGDVSLDLGTQLKGQGEGDEDYDKVYAGLGYSYGPVYVGVAYLGDASEMEHRDFLGIGASLSLMEDLYLAITYQSLDYEMSANRESLDVAATYSFGQGTRLSPACSPTTPMSTPPTCITSATTSRWSRH